MQDLLEQYSLQELPFEEEALVERLSRQLDFLARRLPTDFEGED
ncbi:hypothetical protein U6B65_11030 [Oscillospiraceae bacterium MB08-C2-2]|nr:hypothetical protein U6B65_11030 [Oscillospiraceae bacterium MB08-C2-2]